MSRYDRYIKIFLEICNPALPTGRLDYRQLSRMRPGVIPRTTGDRAMRLDHCDGGDPDQLR
jgi:hypothetical protein